MILLGFNGGEISAKTKATNSQSLETFLATLIHSFRESTVQLKDIYDVKSIQSVRRRPSNRFVLFY